MLKHSFFHHSINQESKSFDFILVVTLVIVAIVLLGNVPLLWMNYYLGADSLASLTKMISMNGVFMLLLFPFVIGFLTMLIAHRFILKQSLLLLFTVREKFDWKRFWFAFVIWGAFLIGNLLIASLSGQPIYFQPKWPSFFILTIISFLILPLQTTFEELFFRSFLHKVFSKLFKKGIVSVVLTGVLFGLMHGANPEVEKIGSVLLLFYIFTGVFLGLIVLMDDGLELSMGYHAVNNIFAALILTNDWQAFQTDALFVDKSPPAFGMENVLTLILIQPLLLYLFSKRYKWMNWKERLLS